MASHKNKENLTDPEYKEAVAKLKAEYNGIFAFFKKRQEKAGRPNPKTSGWNRIWGAFCDKFSRGDNDATHDAWTFIGHTVYPVFLDMLIVETAFELSMFRMTFGAHRSKLYNQAVEQFDAAKEVETDLYKRVDAAKKAYKLACRSITAEHQRLEHKAMAKIAKANADTKQSSVPAKYAQLGRKQLANQLVVTLKTRRTAEAVLAG